MNQKILTRHNGSCHCGAIKFVISSDFPELTRCDCSICKRKGALMVKVHESAFTLLRGSAELSEYQFHTHTARHYFCRICASIHFTANVSRRITTGSTWHAWKTSIRREFPFAWLPAQP